MEENKRAVELKGRNGELVGCADYLGELNCKNIIGEIRTNYSNYEYDKILYAASIKLRDSVKEIVDDCKKNAKYLSFIDRSVRSKLYGFLYGLEKFSEFAGNKNYDCRDGRDYLELKENNTKRKTSASECELDTAVGKIYSGYKYSMNLSDRKELIRKAAEDGMSWAARGDIKKAAFITEVMDGREKEVLKDVVARYEYIHDIRKELDGKCGYDMFSERYINYYEEKIFGVVLQGRYMNNGSYDYSELYKLKLRDIVKQINEDFDKGARGTHFIKYNNCKMLQEAAKRLESLGLDTKYLLLNIKRFEIVDVTNKLDAIFREAKKDGKRLKSEYPRATLNKEHLKKRYEDLINKEKMTAIYENSMALFETIKLILEFIDMVKSWAYYDIKRRFSWSQDLQYMYDGMILDYDYPGNMAFGIVAKAAGMEEFVIHSGAGIYNAYEAIGLASLLRKVAAFLKTIDIKKLQVDTEEAKKVLKSMIDGEAFVNSIDGLVQEMQWITTYLDDPRDYEAIKMGIKYYYKV